MDASKLVSQRWFKKVEDKVWQAEGMAGDCRPDTSGYQLTGLRYPTRAHCDKGRLLRTTRDVPCSQGGVGVGYSRFQVTGIIEGWFWV